MIDMNRRTVFAAAGSGVGAAALFAGQEAAAESQGEDKKGAQRLSLKQLQAWESLKYGMFIHFGMSTYAQNELPDGKAPAGVRIVARAQGGELHARSGPDGRYSMRGLSPPASRAPAEDDSLVPCARTVPGRPL